MDKYYLFFGLALAIIGLIIGFISIIKKKIIAIIIACVIAVIGIVLCFLPLLLFQPSIEISFPENQSIITDYEKKIAENGDELLFSSIRIKGKNLPAGKYIHVLSSVSGGDEYWVNGNPQPTDLLTEGEMTINNITFGKFDDENTEYILYVLVRDEKLTSGKQFTLDKLPEYIIKSKTISIEIKKK